MRVFAILALVALPQPAVAEAPHDGFVQDVAGCYAAAEGRDAAGACIGTGASACFDGAADGQTTFGMMSCLSAEADVWDRLLNEEYAAARARAEAADAEDRPHMEGYAVRAQQVRDAQRAWIAFRDANCAMEYGEYGAGSMRLIAGADCRLRMTAERTLDLRGYLRLGEG